MVRETAFIGIQPIRVWLPACALGLLTACTTLPPEPAFPPDQIPLAEPDVDKAKALAAFAQARLSEQSRDFESAARWYADALRHDPDHLRNHLRASLNLIRLQRGEEAIALLEDLTRRYPQVADVRIWLGSAYRYERRTDEALAAFETALRLAPGDEAVYIQLTDLLVSGGQTDRAISLIKDGVHRVPEPLTLYRLLIGLQLRYGMRDADPLDSEAGIAELLRLHNQALERYPDDVALLTGQSDLLLRQREYELALAGFERLEELDPDNIEVKHRLVSLYERMNRPEDAVRAMEEIARLQPTNARVFLMLGAMYEAMKQRDRAILNYQLAARLGLSEPSAYLKLAVLHLEDGRPERAVRALMDALAQLPGDPRLLEMLGYTHFNQNKYGEARNAFAAARAARQDTDGEPLTPNFHLYHALTHYFTGDPEPAVDLMVEAILGNPETVTVFIHTVFADDDKERSKSLIPILEQLREPTGDMPEVLLALAYAHSFRKQYEESLDYFERVSAAEPEDLLNARFYFWKGAAHERTGDIDRAAELFYQAIALEPGYPEAYNYLAYMWAEKGLHLERAESYVQIALEAIPDSGAFIDTLGWIYYMQGRYEEAYTEIRRALELIPDDPTILDHMGDIYLQLGDEQKAAEYWLASFEADPENETLRAKLDERGLLIEPAEVIDDEVEPDSEELSAGTPLY